MSSQYIFTMYKLSRTHPPDKQVLKDISLSFMPGAKIGVLGLNGSGKSTLLRIMAGLDHDIEGKAVPMPGMKIGFLPQEYPKFNVIDYYTKGMSFYDLATGKIEIALPVLGLITAKILRTSWFISGPCIFIEF